MKRQPSCPRRLRRQTVACIEDARLLPYRFNRDINAARNILARAVVSPGLVNVAG